MNTCTFLALLLSLFTISILHLLAALVSYIIMILVSVASIAGTGFLWYTYVDIRNRTKGKVPKWINGRLFRNGPGASNIGGGLEFGHLFDNFGLIHCFAIQNGAVTYQCRFVKSAYYKQIMSKRTLITDFGTKSVTDPCNTIFHRVKSIFDPNKVLSDNAMITIYPFADELYAFGESPVIHKINLETLETEQSRSVYDHVGLVNHSAHPHIDSEGNVYNTGVSYNKYGKIFNNIACFPRNNNADDMFKEAHIVASIPIRSFLKPSYMHSFGMTENYFVLVQQPLSISLPSFVKNKLFNDPFISSMKWDKRRKTRIDVISQSSGKLVKSFYTSALFFLHIINQYEVRRDIIIDICCYNDPSMINCMYTEALKRLQANPDYAKMFRARPKRFTLNLDGGYDVEGKNICNLGCETPQINYMSYMGRPYRYFYAINSDVDVRYPGTLIKVNVENGHTSTWCEDNCYPSEPIFVANVGSKSEDDGILLSSIVWGKEVTNQIGLLILNAKTMKEICRCVFQTLSPVPKCLHGWYQANRLRKRAYVANIANRENNDVSVLKKFKDTV